MGDDELIETLLEQASKLSHVDRARLIKRLVESLSWNRLGLEEQQAFTAELAGLDHDQRGALAEGQWLALRNLEARLKQIQGEVAPLKHQLEENYKLRTQFLGSMTHELRTPLSAILNFTLLLDKERFGPLNESQKGLLLKILGNAKHLLGLINDIFDLSKIGAGRMELFFEELDLRSLLDGTIATVAREFKDKRLVCQFEPLDLSPRVIGDKTRVRQILMYVLVIVTQLTASQRVTIILSRTDDCICIRVTSDGFSIPEAHHEALLEGFPLIEGLYSGQEVHVGLGSVLSKELAKLMGGDLWLENLSNGSTAFFLTLPITEQSKG